MSRIGMNITFLLLLSLFLYRCILVVSRGQCLSHESADLTPERLVKKLKNEGFMVSNLPSNPPLQGAELVGLFNDEVVKIRRYWSILDHEKIISGKKEEWKNTVSMGLIKHFEMRITGRKVLNIYGSSLLIRRKENLPVQYNFGPYIVDNINCPRDSHYVLLQEIVDIHRSSNQTLLNRIFTTTRWELWFFQNDKDKSNVH